MKMRLVIRDRIQKMQSLGGEWVFEKIVVFRVRAEIFFHGRAYEDSADAVRGRE